MFTQTIQIIYKDLNVSFNFLNLFSDNSLCIYAYKAWKKSSKKIFQTENLTKVMNLNLEVLNIDEEFSVHDYIYRCIQNSKFISLNFYLKITERKTRKMEQYTNIKN